MDLQELRAKLDKHKTKRELLLEQEEQLLADKKTVKQQHSDAVKAREVVIHVANETLAQLSKSVEDLVTQALDTLSENPYTFKMDFVTRRNQTECDLWFCRNGKYIPPMKASGGGAVDVSSFALRCTFLTLAGKRPILFLDEPFKFLSVDKQEYGSSMLQSISEQLGVQIIMVSHLPRIIQSVDRVIKVSLKNDVSSITYTKKD